MHAVCGLGHVVMHGIPCQVTFGVVLCACRCVMCSVAFPNQLRVTKQTVHCSV
jgi:hypothetical protein